MWTCARVHEPGADLEGNGVVRMWMDAEGTPRARDAAAAVTVP